MSTSKNKYPRTSLNLPNKPLRPKANREVSTDRNGKKEEAKKIDKEKDIKVPLKSRKPPTTPPSTRITKTQFFPSKNMYSNALKTQDEKQPQIVRNKPPQPVIKSKEKNREPPIKKSVARERTINSLPKTKPLKKATSNSDDSSVSSERPRTATIRKAPEPKPASPEYEDDFESYESDFEAYSSESATNSQLSEISSRSSSSSSKGSWRELKSGTKRSGSAGTDDERKLDSGNFEISESKHKHLLDNIKESIERENATINLTSLNDEGFEDSKSLQFINFVEAQKKYKLKQNIERMNKRGREILSMIKLDNYGFTLLDLPAVPYEDFINRFGKSNTVQTSTQTNDDYVSEEIQTDNIEVINKWTQFPIVIPKFEVPNDEIYRANYLGVGGDEFNDAPIKYNEKNLEKFLKNTADLIDNLQAEAAFNLQCLTSNLPFSKGYIKYDTTINSNLKNTTITNLAFCLSNSSKFLTIHESEEKCLISLWNISNTSPEATLGAHGEISCASYDLNNTNLIFGGLKTGAILVWDLKETDLSNEIKQPVFSTEIKNGHYCKIVSVQPLADSQKDNIFSVQLKEICSLDEDGEIIIWSVIPSERNKEHWGSITMVVNCRISLTKLNPELGGLQCNDLIVNFLDSNHLYVATNYGHIFHCLANKTKTTVKKLLPQNPSQATCLETCPFSPTYLVAGFDDGNINFYCRQIQRPLIVLSNKDSENLKSKIHTIQWSQNRPFIFYVKDISNTIHVWDLKKCDIFPIYSVPFKEEIVCMKLSTKANPNEESYLVLATSSGSVLIYLLNEEHGPLRKEKYEDDIKKFFNYINRYV